MSPARPQANITILNVQQAIDPVINVAQPLANGDTRGDSAAVGDSPPAQPTAAVSSLTGTRRRLLVVVHGGSDVAAASGGARRLLRVRALAQLPAAEVLAANDTPVQAVDVTMTLQGGSAAQVHCSSDLWYLRLCCQRMAILA